MFVARQQRFVHHIWEQTNFSFFHLTVSFSKIYDKQLIIQAMQPKEHTKTKTETVSVNMQGAEEAGDSISGCLSGRRLKAERIQDDTSREKSSELSGFT